MSLGADHAKIAFKENDEIKYLKDISVEGEPSYTVTNEAGAELLTVDEVMVDIKYLREAEPEKGFYVST